MDFPSRSNEKDALIRELINEYIHKYQLESDESLLNKKYQQLYIATESKIKQKCIKEISLFDSLATLDKRNEEMILIPLKGKTQEEANKALEKLNECRTPYAMPFMQVNEMNSFAQEIFVKELNLCLDECDSKENYKECYRQCFNNGFKYTHKAIVSNINNALDIALKNYSKL